MSKIIEVAFKKTWYRHLEELVKEQFQLGVFPGIEILFAVKGEIVLHQAWGKLEIGKNAPDLEVNTVFDLSSLTQPIATATSIMILQERGLLDVKDCVETIIPEFSEGKKREVTIKHLLTHTSGLPAWFNLFEGSVNKEAAWSKLMEIPLEYPPQRRMLYSKLGYLILGEIIRRLTQQSLDEFTRMNIFDPLKMENTGFVPHKNLHHIMIAPNQYCSFRKKLIQGVVHDENSFMFNEEGGNTGLFSNATDLYQFWQMILNEGIVDGKRILSPRSVSLMQENQNPLTMPQRGLGWNIKNEEIGYISCGTLFPNGSIGHTGSTGTSIWMNCPAQVVVIVLSNRLHLSREKNWSAMRSFRPRLHNILMASLESG